MPVLQTLPENPIDRASFLKKAVITTYLGWGYNPYSNKNKLITEDVLLRGNIYKKMMKQKEAWAALALDYKKDKLAASDSGILAPEEMAIVTRIKRITGEIESLATDIRMASLISVSNFTARFLNETAALNQLKEFDYIFLACLIEKDYQISLATINEFTLEDLRIKWERREEILNGVQ